jgi:hypothetical protein
MQLMAIATEITNSIPAPGDMHSMHTLLLRNKNKDCLARNRNRDNVSIVERRGFAPCFVNYQKGALDSQPQMIKFTSCLPMVGADPFLFCH